jgi:hypothetical protein
VSLSKWPSVFLFGGNSNLDTITNCTRAWPFTEFEDAMGGIFTVNAQRGAGLHFTDEKGGRHPVADGPRVLFEASETGKGDTYLTLQSGTRHRPTGNYPPRGRRIEPAYGNEKISIHPSPGSQEGCSTIHLTMEVKDKVEPSIEGHMLTDAIKRCDSFAWLFARRASDMRTPSYAPKKELKDHISIGSYSPEHSQLLYAVAVSAPELEFPQDASALFKITSHRMSHVRITVLSAIMAAPSDQGGLTSFFTTVSEFDRRAAFHTADERETMKKGRSVDEVLELTSTMFEGLRDDYLEMRRRRDGQRLETLPEILKI